MKKQTIKRRKRVPAATSKSGGNSSGMDGKTAAAEDHSGAPYQPSLDAHEESRMQMSERAAAETLVTVARVRRHADTERAYSITPHRIPSPEGWGDGEPKRKRQRKDIDGPENDQRADNLDMDSRHLRLYDHNHAVRRNGATDSSGREIEKTQASVPPPPLSERLETTTLTLSNSTVGRGLSRNGTPADGSMRDNGFSHDSRAQSAAQLLVPTPPPHTSQHLHPAPVYTINSHQHRSQSRSHTPARETSPLASGSKSSDTHMHTDVANGLQLTRDGTSHLVESDFRAESWQRPRDGVHNLDLPPLSSLQTGIDRDEDNRRAARQPPWTPHLVPEDSTYTGTARNAVLPGSLINGRVQDHAVSNSSHRESRMDQTNGHIVHHEDSELSLPVSITYNHPRVGSNSTARHSNPASPKLVAAHHQLTQTRSPHNPSTQIPPSRPLSRSSHVPSSSELEAHYRKLQIQKAIWEEMMEKTQSYMENIRRAIEEAREREKDIPSNGHNAILVPLPRRPSKGVGKDRIWSWTTNGAGEEQ